MHQGVIPDGGQQRLLATLERLLSIQAPEVRGRSTRRRGRMGPGGLCMTVAGGAHQRVTRATGASGTVDSRQAQVVP